MKKILVVNINWIGDAIFAAPLFKALRESYPGAVISCLAVPRIREILEMVDGLDEIITYDERGAHVSPFAKLKLIGDLRAKNFEAAFLLHRSLTRALLVSLARIPVRVGYDTKNRGIFLTHKVKEIQPQGTGAIHRRDHYLNIIESFGVKVSDRTVMLNVPAAEQQEAGKILAVHGLKKEEKFFVVNCGGNWDLKRWPKENFSLLIDKLQEVSEVKVVVVGAKKDTELVEEIVSLTQRKPLVLTGATTLKQLAAVMQKAEILVSADTGPLHLANALGTPVVGLFGPTRPEVTGPQGRGTAVILQNDVGCNKVPCYFLECPKNVCMQSIVVDDVIKAIKELQRNAGSF